MASQSTTAAATDTARKLNDPALLKRRYAAESRFQSYGLIAISIAMFFLVVLFASIISQGWTAFLQTSIQLDVKLEKSEFTDSDGNVTEQAIRLANYNKLARNALAEALGLEKPSRPEKRDLRGMLSRGIDVQIRKAVEADQSQDR